MMSEAQRAPDGKRHEAAAPDEWSRWLLGTRHGGDPEYARRVRQEVERIAEIVLTQARLSPGMRLLDVGTGDGLIAFRAIERVGPSLQVVMTDLSMALLEHAIAQASQRKVLDQCTFIQGTAEELAGVGDGVADVVTARAVLAYVRNKRAALREFHRVLAPGGRIALGEPIIQDDAFEVLALERLIKSEPLHPDNSFLQLSHRLRAAQFPGSEKAIWESPITNYSERDLVRLVREAGFVDIHMELHIDVRPSLIPSWEVYLKTSPHPWAPTVGDVLSGQFSAAERAHFEEIMRPIMDAGRSTTTDVIAYLWASKPAVDLK